MAVFGMQLVLTMVMASVLSKIIPHFSFAKWLLCRTGLRYYLHPSDDVLKVAAGISKKNGKSGNDNKSKNGNKNSNKSKGRVKFEDEPHTFNIPRNVEVDLEKSKIDPNEVMSLRFYADYQWLLDFAACSAVVYFISEVYLSFLPLKGEINLSMLWCLLVVGFTLKIMFSLTLLYFRGEDSGGEKAMVVLSFFIYLIIALALLLISEEKLDLGLDLAYKSFNQSASAFLKAQGVDSTGPASRNTFKVCMALSCALIGAFYTFPGLRLGKMHWHALRISKQHKILNALFHTSFIAPIFLSLLWVRPLARRYFTEVIFSGYSQPLMTSGMFDTSRLVLVAVVGIIRLCMMPLYLQSYLDLAKEKISELKKETGKITNLEFQRTVARVFYYLCVVSLQYIAPVILCIFLSLMCKTLGGLQWRHLLGGELSAEECGLSPNEEEMIASPVPSLADVDSVAQASKTLSIGLDELKKIFTTDFYRGILGFSTWWCVFSWFLSGTFGVLYQSYFSQR